MQGEPGSALTADHVERFARDGFVVVEGMLADEERTGFGQAVDAAVAFRTESDER